MIILKPNGARRGTSRGRVSALRPNTKRMQLIQHKFVKNGIPYDVLKAKLRESSVVIVGFVLFCLIFIGADILDFVQTGNIDPLMVVITSLLIMVMLPLMLGVIWERRQKLKKRLAAQAR